MRQFLSMRESLIIAVLSGLFGLVPLCVQLWRQRHRDLAEGILAKLKVAEERKKITVGDAASNKSHDLLVEAIDADILKLTKGSPLSLHSLAFYVMGSWALGLLLCATVPNQVWEAENPWATSNFWEPLRLYVGLALIVLGTAAFVLACCLGIPRCVAFFRRRGTETENISE